MKGIITLTQILPMFFIGLTIGGIIVGNGTAITWGIILLVLDIIIGCGMQSSLDTSERKDARNRFIEMMSTVNEAGGEDDEEEYDEEECDEEENIEEECNDKENIREDFTNAQDRVRKMFYREYSKLREFARIIEGKWDDPAVNLLFAVCNQMPYSPPPHSLFCTHVVVAEDLDGLPAIVFDFAYNPNSIAQNVFVFLVMTKEEKIRFFTVETSVGKSFMLCEYTGSSHCNYGKVDLKNALTRIKEVLNENKCKAEIPIKVGSLVEHFVFGKGTVVDISNNYISVSFSSVGGNPIKKFPYPDAIRRYFNIIKY